MVFKRMLVVILGSLGLLGSFLHGDGKLELQRIYTAYDREKNEFVGQLPGDRNYCLELLRSRKQLVTNALNGFSYKNVLFSSYSLSSMAAMLTGAAGSALMHTMRLNALQNEVPVGTATWGGDLVSFNPYWLASKEAAALSESDFLAVASSFAEANKINKIWNSLKIREAEELSSPGFFSVRYNSWVRAGVVALGALSVVAGFGVIDNMRLARDLKNQLSAELDKINKILSLLEKA